MIDKILKKIMWDTISDVLTSSNSIFVISFLLILAIIISFLIKNGNISINTKHVKIGEDEKERAILRQQTEWTYQYVTGLYGVIIPKYPEFDKMKARYVLECIYDEVINWILFNHITRSEMYIMVKREKLRGAVLNMDVNDICKSDEFRELIYTWTKEMINRLVDIREYYNGKK